MNPHFSLLNQSAILLPLGIHKEKLTKIDREKVLELEDLTNEKEWQREKKRRRESCSRVEQATSFLFILLLYQTSFIHL